MFELQGLAMFHIHLHTFLQRTQVVCVFLHSLCYRFCCANDLIHGLVFDESHLVVAWAEPLGGE